jgi:hypothetical protein
LIWSRHFRLTEDDLDALLDTVKANPGALVIIDSLRSISRCLQHGENDPEIGATLYDLKQAVIDSGGTLLLIHHCNKAADLVVTEALSGHNAIAGAANTLITLHYCPDAKDRPDKDSPQRRMFCEGRSVPGCDVVIDRAAGGSFRLVSTFSKWQQQLAEARKQQKQTDQLTPTQQDLLDYLEARPDQRFTRRQLVEELELDWGDGGKSSDGVRVRESLQKLQRLELIQKVLTGKEHAFFVSREAQKQSSLPSLPSPSSDGNGFQGEDGEVGASPCDPLMRQEEEQREEGEAVRKGDGLIPGFVVASSHPTGSSWDSGDGDDPAWGPRPEVA